MKSKSQKYVVGFLFSYTLEYVALIRKQKPEWQAGLLNGIGGKIEPGEKPEAAMEREFKEETGCHHNAWRKFCVMSGNNNDGSEFELFCFWKRGDLTRLKSMEVEKVEIHPVGAILLGYQATIPNPKWLIPLAIDSGTNTSSPTSVVAKYGKPTNKTK